MAANRIQFDLHAGVSPIQDPGDAKTIVCDRSPATCSLVSVAAETRTLGRPTVEGDIITLHHRTDGGDITVTVTGGYDEAGTTTITFSDGGQFATFVALYDGTNYFWRLIGGSNTIAASVFTTITATTANITTGNAVTFTVSAATATPVAISNGDGTTASTPKAQILGANKADGSLLIGVFSATATSVATPSLNFLKSAHATVGSNTVIASGEVLGEINWLGADGTDFKSAAVRIAGIVDTTPGTGDMPGRLVISTSIDAGETLTEALRVDNAQRVVVGAVAAQSISTGDGSTSSTPRMQLWGTTSATASLLVGCANASGGTSGTLSFARTANAAVGSFTVVASGASLGQILWFGDNGTDYLSPAARIECIVDATPGATDMPGRIVFSTTTDGTETLTEAVRIDNAQRLVVGAVAAQTVSTGDGATSAIPRGQLWGTTNATASFLLGCSSATAGTAAGLAFARSKNAAVGSFTVVASGDAMGAITWFGDNGTDYLSPAAQIAAFSDATPGAADMPGRITFLTTNDGAETLTEKWRINNVGVLTSLAGTPANAGTVIGSILPSGGIAITDVANAWIDDATHGSGTVSHLIGNQTITTSSDIRIKKDIAEWKGNACEAFLRAPRIVEFTYDHPAWGGDRADPSDEDARKWGPNARGRYIGFIAQELIEMFPWVVNAGAGKDCPKCRAGEKCDNPEHPFMHVEYQHMVPMVIKAIQELTERLKALERKAA